jgi:hypothetical protein
MTIAIGLLCSDGIVLGADREVSLYTLKVREPKAHVLKRVALQIGLVGAGSSDLIKLATQELDRKLVDRMTADEVREVIDDLATEIHQRHVLPNPGAEHADRIA